MPYRIKLLQQNGENVAPRTTTRAVTDENGVSLDTIIADIQTTSEAAIPLSQIGTAGGVAELDESGKVISSQLPSYVDDVEEYSSQSDFPVTGESGKIYIDTNTNLSYRWTGSAYTEIPPSIALGETSATAYRGDRGKIAYDHSQDSTVHVTSSQRSALSSAIASGGIGYSSTPEPVVIEWDGDTTGKECVADFYYKISDDCPNSVDDLLGARVTITPTDSSYNNEGVYAEYLSAGGFIIEGDITQFLVDFSNGYFGLICDFMILCCYADSALLEGLDYYLTKGVWVIKSPSMLPFYISKIEYTPKGGQVNQINPQYIPADNNKVDKIEGKGLSENDYTTAEKTKVTKNTTDIGDLFKTEAPGTSPAYTQATGDGLLRVSEIEMIGGKSQGWNQQNSLATSTTESYTRAGVSVQRKVNGFFSYVGTTTGGMSDVVCAIKFITDHKYLRLINLPTITSINGSVVRIVGHASSWRESGACGFNIFDGDGKEIRESIVTSQSGEQESVVVDTEAIDTGTTINFEIQICYIDLTTIFGAGNEPSTTTDPRIIEIKRYAEAHPEYNAGDVIHGAVDEVQAVGWNICDENWEAGGLSWATGELAVSSGRLRSKNFIPCIGGTTYYIKGTVKGMIGYDATKSFVSRIGGDDITNTTITFPDGVEYFKIVYDAATYNHDICINKSQPDMTRYPYNGVYLPYHPTSYKVPEAIKNLPGYGWSAGNVYNQVDFEPVTYHNMKAVDLGSFTWIRTTSYTNPAFYCYGVSDAKCPANDGGAAFTILSDMYSSECSVNSILTGANSDKHIALTHDGRFYIRDDSYSDATAFANAVSGKIIHYEATSGGTDYEAKLYTQRVGAYTFTGTENWSYHASSSATDTNRFSIDSILPSAKAIAGSVVANLISPTYVTVKNTDTVVGSPTTTGLISIYNTSNKNYVIICDTSCTSKAELQTKTNGQTIYYELSTPFVYDITSLLPPDNYIDTELNGQITLHQTGMNFSLPNRITHHMTRPGNGVQMDQGVSKAGQFLVVGTDGRVTTQAIETMAGGVY